MLSKKTHAGQQLGEKNFIQRLLHLGKEISV